MMQQLNRRNASGSPDFGNSVPFLACPHWSATYYNALTKNPYKVCYVTGDIIKTVKRHYMRAVKKKVCDAFWGLTPSVVLTNEKGQLDASRSAAPSEITPEQKQPDAQGV